MAVKASDQISLIDMTDSYSVVLSNDAITLNATSDTSLGTQTSVTVNVLAFQGADQLDPSVTQAQIVCPTGVTPLVGSISNHVLPITFTFPASLASGGMIQIPVVLNSGEITIVKVVSFSIAFKGTNGQPGQPGVAGEDAIMIDIESSNGLFFKNTSIATTLTAHVYKGGAEITGSGITALGTLKWYINGTEKVAARGSATTSISAGDVQDKADIVVKLEA